MAFSVNFYKFNKNPNSTKRPTEPDKTYNCVLIEPTSIVNPSIALVDATSPHIYNYAYIPEFSRYYFVNDWNYDKGRWVATLNVDTLASFKNEIGASKQYVLRSAAEFNGDIVDNLYPAENSPDVVSVYYGGPGQDEDPFISDLASGIFVVGIINDDINAIGAVSYYKFTNTQFRNFCKALMQNADWAFSGIEEISTELFKSLFNPFQYVASCMWFPFTDAFPGTNVNSIPYGWWSLPTSATRISKFTRLAPAFFTPPKHPQAETRGAYLNAAPYSRYKLVWPVFGVFPLDANVMAKCERLRAECWVDAVSGKGCLQVFSDTGNNAIFTSTQTVIGVPIQIAQVTSDYLGAATSAAGGVADFITGDISGGISAIGNAIKSAMPQVRTQGSNGMTTSYYFPPVLECEFYRVVEESNENRGRPLCQERVVNTLSGYQLIADAELEAPCTASELDTIKNYMNGGFFYE